MNLNPLTAISPVDGRYYKSTRPIAVYFSEYGLIRYRIRIEGAYFAALVSLLPELKGAPKGIGKKMADLYKNFTEQDAAEVKKIEKITNHDVKAVEYFMKQKLSEWKGSPFAEFIHFALTSQDINNTAIPLLTKEYIEAEYIPQLTALQKTLATIGSKWKNIPMLAHTHGQPASPTTVGKELMVFVTRLDGQLSLLKKIPHSAKFGGATGNMNAHFVAYPAINWNKFAAKFVEGLGLVRSHPTTQIEHYDNLAALLDNMKRINTILIDLSRDMWQYISMGYFTQRTRPGEVGSSTMPHKINPIDFENAEGNLGYANGIFEYMSAKLPVSRLQRDLTDSTVLRNLGVPLAHTFLAVQSLQTGIAKIEVNKDKIREDLDENWAVVGEAIQTILRKEGYPNPYEALKELTRKNKKITKQDLAIFIKNLDVKDGVKKKLLAITPFNYTGKV